MKKPWRRILSAAAAALCLAALPLNAYADETADGENTQQSAIFDADELETMTEDFISEYSYCGLKSENISIAYTYLATGETWFYNPDKWYYSASMYKVPLMMLLAEKEADGELTQESDVKGLTLAYAEESILVYSNNDYAHLMLNYLGTDEEAREMYKRYSSLSDDYYDSDFIDYSYFTARFMNDVMTTLYTESERFPHIIDCLKLAQPTDFFHLYIDPSLEVAQKYGSYDDSLGNSWNHTTGIIYTQNPIILTVMTEDVTKAEMVIGQAAKLFTDYTLTLDPLLDGYLERREAAEAESASLAEEADEAGTEAEAQTVVSESAPVPTAQPTEAAAEESEETHGALPIILICICAAALTAVLCLAFARKKSRAQTGADRGGYTPRH